MPLNWNVTRLGRVESTQQIARDYALSGAPSGLVIVAEVQTDGRGRHGRRWHSPMGGLYMTVVLRSIVNVRLLPLLAGVAAAEAIEAFAGIEAELKWPNDVLVGGKKIGGVIAESGWSGGEVKFTLLGVGVNVNNPLPEDVPEATTLAREIGAELDIESLLQKLLGRLGYHLQQLGADPSMVLESWRRKAQTLGRRVEVKDASGEIVKGLAVDIDPEGALILETEGGRRKIVSGGLGGRYS
jgi:BirA family biotin operon repressor/biotin-[acetyl-CoA-carboxylase] ligase